MNGVTPKLERLVRRLLASLDEPEDPSGARHLDAIPGAYRRVLLVLDRNSAPEVAARDLLARMPTGSSELALLRLLPEWAQDSLETQTRDELGRVAWPGRRSTRPQQEGGGGQRVLKRGRTRLGEVRASRTA